MLKEVLIFEYFYDVVIFIDIEGNIIDWNLVVIRMFGYSKIDVLGKILVILYKEEIVFVLI